MHVYYVIYRQTYEQILSEFRRIERVNRNFPDLSGRAKKNQHLESTCHNVTGVYKIESLSINSSAEQIALNAPFVVFFFK